MSSTPREIGTLIVVVLRANHLPNKRHIGKQDPYCTVTLNSEKRRTKAIRKGGQHPEWDEEIRFTIFEDLDDVLARTAQGDATPPPPPPKDAKKTKQIKGGKSMKLACYADDLREPELIGECDVDLSEVLTKGETDDWFTLMNKDKFAGKVYLELTFWSNEPAPEKKSKPKVSKNNQYAGPGSFVPSDVPSVASSTPHSRQVSDVLPSSMKTSNPAANFYVPPYEGHHQVESLAQGFSEFGLSGRRDSFPPVPGNYPQPQLYGMGHSSVTPYSSHNYNQSISGSTAYSYERPMTPNDQSSMHFPHSTSSPVQYPSYQQPTYGAAPPVTYQPPTRRPRHSIATSSGFAPLPEPSGFLPLPSHASEPSGFLPPVSHTPVPAGFISQFHPPHNVYPSMSHTPAPPANPSYLPQSNSLSFQPQSSMPTPYSYPSFSIPTSASAPPQQPISTSSQPHYPPPANSTPPQIFPTSPSHESSATPPSTFYSNGLSSRPLPLQPQVLYTQASVQQPPILPSHSLSEPPPPPPVDQHRTSVIYPSAGYSDIPPPPPLQYNTSLKGVASTPGGSQLVPPPPPPPLPNANGQSRVRRTSLPAPPMNYQQPVYQQPPPPPPVMEYFNYNKVPPPPPLPSQGTIVGAQNTTLDKGLPKPPVPVNEHGQWAPAQNVYAFQGY